VDQFIKSLRRNNHSKRSQTAGSACLHEIYENTIADEYIIIVRESLCNFFWKLQNCLLKYNQQNT